MAAAFSAIWKAIDHRMHRVGRPSRRSKHILSKAIIEALEPRVLLSMVTSTADSGTGSLRAAILAAETAGGTQTITFAPTLTGETINLNSGALALSSTSGTTLTIRGPTTGSLVINAGAHSQAFTITSGSIVAINNLTITDGSGTDGGAIENLGNLTVSASTISGSTASKSGGGIYSAMETAPMPASLRASYTPHHPAPPPRASRRSTTPTLPSASNCRSTMPAA